VQVVPIRNVAADALAAELVKQADLRGGEAVTVTIDPRTNSLILRSPAGRSDELPALLKRIAELDDRSRSKWTGIGTVCGRPLFTQVVFLRSAPASEVARGVGGLRPGVQIEADPRTNSLVVSAGSEQDLGETLLEIGRLDREEPPQH
jgi:type II secretory pathway component GspD/PulD (secretin)